MKIKKLITSMAACTLAISMVAPSAFAAESRVQDIVTAHGTLKISEDTVVDNAKGSITLYKLLENDGQTYEADGQFDEAADATDKVPNIEFSRVKIGTLENVGGTVAGSGDAAGFYYQLTDEFKTEANTLISGLDKATYDKNGDNAVSTADFATVITQGGTEQKDKYFSAEQVENLLNAMKHSNDAVYGRDLDATTGRDDVDQTWKNATAASATGETAINAWVDKNGTAFAVTDKNGRTSADNLDLGLYLIAETGYVDMNGEIAKTTYRSRTYDANGVMSGTTDTVKPTEAQTGAQGANPTQQQIADTYDHNYTIGENGHGDDTAADSQTSDGNPIANVPAAPDENTSTADPTHYHDGTAVDGSQYSVAQVGTENPYVIENPCSPFLVSVPMTNVSSITGTIDNENRTLPAGSVWQYDVTVYPKNAATTIYKRVIADNGNDFDCEQDYVIGQNIEQVIYADAPATMFNHQYQQFEIKDTMSNGLTLQKVTRVAVGPKVADPTNLDAFKSFYDMTIGADYNVYTVDKDGAETLNAEGIVPSGVSDTVRSFIVKLTPQGLSKISDTAPVAMNGNDPVNIAGNKQVVVVFDTVLNKNAVIGAATKDGKLQFNVNAPTLTWRHDNTATRSIDGNEVKLYTYELDLTKIGKDITEILDDTSDTQQERDNHSFDAAKTAFTVMQNSRKDATYELKNNVWTTGHTDLTANKNSDEATLSAYLTGETRPTTDPVNGGAYITFVQEIDDNKEPIPGVYHIYSAADGPIKEIVRYNAKAVEDADDEDKNATYQATPAEAGEIINGMPVAVDASRGLTVYQIVKPAPSGADASKDASGNEGGLLVLKGIDSETYTFTELSTSKSFNLLSETFDVTLNAPEIKDGNLVANDDATKTYGASLTTNGETTGLAHKRGIVRMSVNNYKTITLHTGGTGMMMIYAGAVVALLAAAMTAMHIQKKKRVA